jgi:hypothetical protein
LVGGLDGREGDVKSPDLPAATIGRNGANERLNGTGDFSKVALFKIPFIQKIATHHHPFFPSSKLSYPAANPCGCRSWLVS